MKKNIFNNKNLFFLIFFIIIFLLQDNKVFANLEVGYPVITTMAGESTEAVSAANLPSYVKYIFVWGTGVGFLIILLTIIISGILYFLSPINAQFKKEAKDRVMGAISGLLILVLSYLIITTINPQLNIFKLDELEDGPEPEILKVEHPGVYFYKSADCSDPKAEPNVSSILDFGELRRGINSVKVVPDIYTSTNYITILYENPNLWGKCEQLTDESGSETGSECFSGSQYNDYSSASIYSFDFEPDGDGVYFFNKPCFNYGEYNDIDKIIESCKKHEKRPKDPNNPDDTGDIVYSGYYYIPNSDIKDIYVGKLDNLFFEGVPEEEQICKKYDKYNKCVNRAPPTLAGENISSIIVNGNYLVLMVYFGSGDDPSGQWSSCQEFPKSNDENWLGPRQIRWDLIRNTKDVVPNYVIIFPIKPPSSPTKVFNPKPIPAQ